MNGIERRIKEIEKRIKEINKLRMIYAHKTKGKTKMQKLRTERRKLRKEQKALIEYVAKHGYLIDLTSMSVIPLNLKKSRYLRNNKGYFNSYNFIFAKHGKTLFAYLTKYSQITKKDLESMKALIHQITKEREIMFITDNRHQNCLNAHKNITMEIERVFSIIKKRIYPKIRDKQYYRKGKIYTDITIEELFNLYLEEFKRLNVIPLNF